MLIEKTFCTTRQAADLLGISVGTVQFWVDSGLLSAWKTPGGHRRVTRASIDSLLYGGKEKLAELRAAPAALQDSPAPLVVSPEQINLVKIIPLPTGRKRLKILMIEGDISLRQRYEAAFKNWPISPDVAVVGTVREGLAAFEREPADMLIADLDTTGLDSLELASGLKHLPGHSDLCLVLVGGFSLNIIMLSKPLPLGKLLLIARKTLKSKAAKSLATVPASKRVRA